MASRDRIRGDATADAGRFKELVDAHAAAVQDRLSRSLQELRALLHMAMIHAWGLWRAYRSDIAQVVVFNLVRAAQIKTV